MLAVTANWGLTDGSLGGTRPTTASRWLDRVRMSAVRAGFGPTGRYRPVEDVTLVFAGDTFDMALSDRWMGRDRPWHGGPHGRAVRRAALAAVVREAARPIARLRSWLRHGLAVPAADTRGRPAPGFRCRVNLAAVLLVGDRDGRLGDLADQADGLGVMVGSAWTDGRHEIRHGHEFDPLRFSADDPDRPACEEGRPTLAESISADLIVPFGVAVRGLPAAWPSIRPLLGRLAASGVGAEGMAGQMQAALARLPPQHRAAVASAWQRSVEGWFLATRREPPACDAGLDAPAALAAWLAAAGRGQPAPEPAALTRWLEPACPPGHPAMTTVIGHLAPVRPAHGSVVCLGDAAPRLMIRPRPDAAADFVMLDQPAAGSAVVRVGEASPGRGVVDAA